jgi:hypothetical protein
MSRVLKKGFDKRQGLLSTILFLDGLHGAELQYCLSACLLWREACPKVFRRLQSEMILDLLVHPFIVLSPYG